MLGGKVITVYGKVPEYAQSQQRFMTKQSVTITSVQVIKLLVSGIANISASELLNECKKIDMRQVPYQHIGLNSNLPSFDTGYHYDVGYPMNVGEIEIINYGNENTIAYLSHTKITGNDVITIRVGNRRFWD
jgi:hypothetical protein